MCEQQFISSLYTAKKSSMSVLPSFQLAWENVLHRMKKYTLNKNSLIYPPT